jgi:hypothetical protein
MFESNKALKFTELDNWMKGCTGPCQTTVIDYPIKGKTLDDVISAICTFLDCARDDVSVNPCDDDPSRIDAQTSETAEGYPASLTDWDKFKRGEIELYACTYSWNFEQVTRSPANFAKD